MAIDRDLVTRTLVTGYRGAHGSGGRQRRSPAEWVRIAVVLAVVGILALILAAALRPSLRGRSSLLPPAPVPSTVDPPAAGNLPQPSLPAGPVAPPTAPAVSAPPDGPPAAPTERQQPPQTAPAQQFPVAPRIRAFSIEAESAANTLTGKARVRTVAAASGGLAIGDLGAGSANTLRVNGVAVPGAGVYTMSVFYLSGEDRSLAVNVDGGPGVLVGFPSTGSFQTVGSLTLRVELRAGTNTIGFANAASPGPDVDRITIGN
jgi:hypothetical protein